MHQTASTIVLFSECDQMHANMRLLTSTVKIDNSKSD